MNSAGPDGKDIHSGERETNGKYTFAAHLGGLYKYCFSNQVIFDFHDYVIVSVLAPFSSKSV